MISSVCSFEIINILTPDPNIFWWIAASVAADAAAVNHNGIKRLFANGLIKKAIWFLVITLKVYLQILLIVLFYVIEFLIILY